MEHAIRQRVVHRPGVCGTQDPALLYGSPFTTHVLPLLRTLLDDMFRIRLANDSVGFNLNQHVRIDQALHLHHGGRGPNRPEHFAMCATDFLPLIDIGHINARTHHIRN